MQARAPSVPGTKKAGGEAGGLHRPSTLPTEGGDFHRKVTVGDGRWGPSPGKRRRRGRLMPATLSIGLTAEGLALRQRHRHEARRAPALDPHQHAVLVAVARGVDRLAYVAGAGDAFTRHLEDDVAFLEAAFRRGTLRIDLGDH